MAIAVKVYARASTVAGTGIGVGAKVCVVASSLTAGIRILAHFGAITICLAATDPSFIFAKKSFAGAGSIGLASVVIGACSPVVTGCTGRNRVTISADVWLARHAGIVG